MPVPETAMHEDDRSSRWEDDVWGARQALHMQAITKATRVKGSPQYPFRPSIPSSYTGHVVASLLRCQRIWPYSSRF